MFNIPFMLCSDSNASVIVIGLSFLQYFISQNIMLLLTCKSRFKDTGVCFCYEASRVLCLLWPQVYIQLGHQLVINNSLIALAPQDAPTS